MNIYFSNFIDNGDKVLEKIKTEISERCDSKREMNKMLSDVSRDVPIIISHLRELRKADSRYDVKMYIDKHGYYYYTLYFLITDDEANKAFEEYESACKKYGRMCCRLGEKLYSVAHRRVESDFNWIDMELMSGYKSYGRLDGNKYLKTLEFGRTKRV